MVELSTSWKREEHGALGARMMNDRQRRLGTGWTVRPLIYPIRFRPKYGSRNDTKAIRSLTSLIASVELFMYKRLPFLNDDRPHSLTYWLTREGGYR
jgi:hypothetical protein